jgi:hypothetical protein
VTEERQNVGTDEWPQGEGVSGGTEGGLGTGATGSDTGEHTESESGPDMGAGTGPEEATGGTGSWTDPGSEDITRHSGP